MPIALWDAKPICLLLRIQCCWTLYSAAWLGAQGWRIQTSAALPCWGQFSTQVARASSSFPVSTETKPTKPSRANFAQMCTTEPLLLLACTRKTMPSIQGSFLVVWEDDHNGKGSRMFSAKTWIGFCASSATKCPQHLSLKSLMLFAVSLLCLNTALPFFAQHPHHYCFLFVC